MQKGYSCCQDYRLALAGWCRIRMELISILFFMKGCYYTLLFLKKYFKYFFFHLGDSAGHLGDFI